MLELCPACGAEVAPGLLACPNCRRLVHADRLKQLADVAGRAEAAGDPIGALVAWRGALELLPPRVRQREVIEGRIAALGRQVEAGPARRSVPGTRGPWGTLAGIGTMLLLGAGKLKFLMLGLTKASTFFSMFAALGVYWAAFGWKFALGLVVSVYIHEMGHVAALLRYGIRADAPLFIPGLGAVIRLRQALGDPRQDARVGLAGPVWGLGAALASGGVFLAGGGPIWGAIAQFGAIINLFNLTPVWQLDGSRAFRSFSRSQRGLAATAVALAWYATGEGWLLLIMIVAGARFLFDRTESPPDRGALATYVGLVAALSALSLISVGVAG